MTFSKIPFSFACNINITLLFAISFQAFIFALGIICKEIAPEEKGIVIFLIAIFICSSELTPEEQPTKNMHINIGCQSKRVIKVNSLLFLTKLIEVNLFVN